MYILFIIISIITLTNCSVYLKSNSNYYHQHKTHTKTILTKKNHIQWSFLTNSLRHEISNMIKKIKISFKDKKIYISDIQNNINYDINLKKIQKIIICTFKEKLQDLSVIKYSNIQRTKKKLNLLLQDTLINRNKALLLSKKMNSDYLLFSSLYTHINQLLLEIQLILTKSGEIIWQSNISIKTECN